MTAEKQSDTPKAGRNILGMILRYGLPLVLTVGLVWYMFKKVNFEEMIEIIHRDVDWWWWILAAMGVSVFSHIFRAARWRLQLRGLGINPPFIALCVSIFGTYALNLLFPRLGEVWRCTYIAGREKSPLTKVFGSMVADRLSDTLMVLLLTILTFIVAAPALHAFLQKYPVGRDTIQLLTNPVTWIMVVLVIALIWSGLRLFRNTTIVKKLRDVVSGLWKGFAVVINMKGRGRFILLTFAIWGCYFLQLYLAFFAFTFTRHLCVGSTLAFGLTPCLVAFVLSSIGMAIPSNGGLGPWNIAVMFGLAIYGISDAQGTSFSMLVWCAQTVMLIILGIFSMIYLATEKRRVSPIVPPTA